MKNQIEPINKIKVISKEELLENIKDVEKLASASKLGRLLNHPFKYLYAILFRELIYRFNKKEKLVSCETFFKKLIHVYLPSSTDIYLTKGKSHLSEIKLARFIIQNLKTNDCFLDIGAHYGYFSLLASSIVGANGKVLAFEASPVTFKILKKNADSNIIPHNKAISENDEAISFYQFPNLYSEFNTSEISQFQDETWFKNNKPQKITVPAQTINELLLEHKVDPKIIKIDVEGAEFKVLKGGKNYLLKNSPLIVMEFLAPERDNQEHLKAETFLKDLGFQVHCILNDGKLEPVKNGNHYLKEIKMESANLVFIRP